VQPDGCQPYDSGVASSHERTETLSAGGGRRDRVSQAGLEPDFGLHTRNVGELLDLGADVLAGRFLLLVVPACLLWIPSTAFSVLGFDVDPDSPLAAFVALIINVATSMLVTASVALVTFRAIQGQDAPLSEALKECLRVLPNLTLSVWGVAPNSGDVVWAQRRRPAAL